MTPEQFEAKWGEALRAAGHTVNNLPSGNGLYINGKWFDGRCLVQEDSRAYARGLLVAWAAERGHSVERLCWHEFGEPIGEGWGMSDGDALVSSNDFADFDDALIAGCIALAKQGT